MRVYGELSSQLRMADIESTVAPGTTLRFGTLLFIVNGGGEAELRRPPPPSVDKLLSEAMLGLRVTAPENPVCDTEELRRRLDAFLGPRPSQDNVRLALVAPANVSSRLAGGGSYPPGTTSGVASPSTPPTPRAQWGHAVHHLPKLLRGSNQHRVRVRPLGRLGLERGQRQRKQIKA